MTPPLSRTVLGGAVGTVVMTVMMYFVAPAMLGTSMDIADLLSWMMGGSWLMGMVIHFATGVLVFPVVYALAVYSSLPGEPLVRGVLWGIVLWLAAQTLVMPMTGAGLFSANIGGSVAALASLVGHALYGGFLGFIAGTPAGTSD